MMVDSTSPITGGQKKAAKNGSSRVVNRVSTEYSANMNAEATGNSAAQVNTPAPGRKITSTPTQPMATASQRFKLILSPKTGPDIATTNNGQTVKIAKLWISPISV